MWSTRDSSYLSLSSTPHSISTNEPRPPVQGSFISPSFVTNPDSLTFFRFASFLLVVHRNRPLAQPSQNPLPHRTPDRLSFLLSPGLCFLRWPHSFLIIGHIPNLLPPRYSHCSAIVRHRWFSSPQDPISVAAKFPPHINPHPVMEFPFLDTEVTYHRPLFLATFCTVPNQSAFLFVLFVDGKEKHSLLDAWSHL